MNNQSFTRGTLKKSYLSLASKYPKLGPFILGCLLSLAFAPLGFPPIIFIVMPLIIYSLLSFDGWKKASNYGWWFGFGHFLTSLFWIGNSFLAQSEVPIWAAPIAVFALAYILAYTFSLTFGLTNCFNGPRWAKFMVFASIWSIVEWVRGHIFTGFPWNPLGVIWTSVDTVMQTASIFGVYGLTFFTVLIATSVPYFLVKKNIKKGEFGFLIINFILVGIILGFGFFRLGSAEVIYHPNISFRIVQANIPQKEKWVRENWSKNFYQHIEMSKVSDVNNTVPDFVIWPETAIPYFIGSEPGRQVLLAEMLGNKSAVISGAPRIERLDNSIKLYNSVHVIDKGGRLKGTYDKVHLVPFGEYLPLRGVLGRIGLGKFTDGSLDFSSGVELKSLEVTGIPEFGVLICYEVIFPGQAVGKIRPQWLLNVTNDGWFGNSPGPYQHFEMARMRAVEEGLPLVRSAGTGISGVIDPWGRVLGELRLNTTGVLDSKLPKRIEKLTIYSQFGDLIFFFTILFSLIPPFFPPSKFHFRANS